MKNFLEGAVILSPGAVLEVPIDELTHLSETMTEPITLKDAERAHIARTLHATNGVIAAAVARLGLPRSTLF